MKPIAVTVTLLALVINGNCVIPVIDYTHIAQDAWHEIINFAKWSAQYEQEVQTELNTLNTYEQEVLQVVRAGDPAQFRNLPGIQNIATLEAIYSQVQQDYADINAVANPANFEENANSILEQYKQAVWYGFTAADGTRIGMNQGSFQFDTSSYTAVKTVEQQMTSLDNQKKKLQQQKDSANNSLQSATTTAQVDKFHAVINSINGALADVNSSIQQLFNHATMQQQQNAAAQKVYQASRAEKDAADAYRAIDSDMQELPSQGFRQLSLWQ